LKNISVIHHIDRLKGGKIEFGELQKENLIDNVICEENRD
jgi:hypothetical protein